MPNPEGMGGKSNKSKGNKDDKGLLDGQNVHLTKPSKDSTHEKIADETGVSGKTVQRSAKYAQAIDTISENSGIMPQVLMSEIRMTEKEVMGLSIGSNHSESLETQSRKGKAPAIPRSLGYLFWDGPKNGSGKSSE